MKRRSSLRRTAAPIPVALMASSRQRSPLLRCSFPGALPLTHGASAGGDGLHDIMVARAPAEIAFELVPAGLVIELLALAVHDIDGRPHHAPPAIAALHATMPAA